MKWIRILPLLLIASCTSLDNAPIGDNGTFFKLYGEGDQNEAKDIRVISDGFVATGISQEDVSIIYTFDNLGNITSKDTIGGFEVNSLHVVSDNEYLVIGDIKDNDTDLSHLHLIRITRTGSTLSITPITGETTHPEFYQGFDGHGFAVLENNGSYVVQGSQETGEMTSDQVVWAEITESGVTWITFMLERQDAADIEASRSIHRSTTDQIDRYILNANYTVRDDDNDLTSLYIGSFQEDRDLPDGNTNSNDLTPGVFYSGAEVQPSSTNTEYAIVGTTKEPSSETGDIFFARVDELGVLDASSLRRYTALDNGNTNDQDDLGLSLDSTDDGGYILLGSRGTRPGADTDGKGLGDFLLIKTDLVGTQTWTRVIGSEFDESIGVVRQTVDGGYIIFGTSDFNGLRNFTLIKTDENGNVK